MATVDIIVRTKDRPVFVRRALASIRAQTFSDWRILLVNDGGDPAVLTEVVAAAGPDLADRLVRFDHETSRGRWPSANHGVREATAPLLVLHDDDDTWHPEFLERAVAHLDENPEEIGVVSRIEIVWEQFADDTLTETGREVFQPQLTAPFLADLLLFNRFVPIAFLYRREAHELVGEYREDLAVAGDWDFNRRILVRWPLQYLPGEPLAFWHQRPGQVGVAGNSVIATEHNHRHYDKWVRDAHLREEIQRDGDGSLLYLTKFVDDRVWDLEHHVDQEVRAATRVLEERVEDLRRELQRQNVEVHRQIHRASPFWWSVQRVMYRMGWRG